MKKQCVIDSRWFMAALVMSLGLAASPSPAAAISGGDHLGPGGTFTLTSYVGPCVEDPALTVESATLNLNGFTVSGNGSNTCIQVEGTRSAIRGAGTVQACHRGVVIAGGGRHVVRDVISEFHTNNGFLLASHNSALVNSISRFNMFVGVGMGNVGTEPSRFNLLSGNTASNNNAEGFQVIGESHLLVNNTASNNGYGFHVYVGLANRIALLHNTASNNNNDGFNVYGVNNVLRFNTATSNLAHGITIQEQGNNVEDNTATGNTLTGFRILGDGNKVEDNFAANNHANGIEVLVGATGNQLTENVGGNNTPFDLADDNLNCDQNRWRRNTGTRNQSCIR
jgi:parallel beta-helix repeat protein